jgi:hypothetical protein
MMNPVPDANAQGMNGTRLKLKWYAGADGSKQLHPYVFYDSQRQEDCGPTLAGDGKLRCVPTASAYPSSYYLDSACSQPMLVASCGTPAKYASAVTGGAACAGYRPAKLTAISRPSGLWTGGGAIACTAAPAATVDAVLTSYANVYTLYSVGPEVPATEFVELTEQVQP